MKKMNLPVIAVALVAVCMVAIVATLAVKATNTPDIQADVTGSVGNNSNYYNQYEEVTTSPFEAIIETTAQVIENTFVPSQATTKKPEPSTQNPTKPETTVSVSQMQEEVTVPNLEDMSQGVATKPVENTGSLPQDMTFAGLSRMGYDVIGLKSYIYNDDKDPDCFQANLGYHPIYDIGANLIDFSIETTKIDFTYEDKKYRFQFWKGQYISGEIGTVGGEIGIYTLPKGSAGQFYNCAEQDDWLKMEMTVFWDEFDNGEYLPQFTRNYNDFWWCTGFVDGQLKNRRDSNTMRVLARITFESVEQAEAFDKAMEKKGFTKVENFSPDEIDTYKRHGKDVIFMWQNVR